MRVLGIDLAHGRTGTVLLPSTWTSGWAGRASWTEVQHLLVDGAQYRCLPPVERRDQIITAVLNVADALDADLLVAEEHFTARNSAAALLAKLHGELERRCHVEQRELRKVTRSEAYRLAVGKGNASKAVLQAMLQHAGAPFWECEDLCDAWAVANLALSHAGHQFLGAA